MKLSARFPSSARFPRSAGFGAPGRAAALILLAASLAGAPLARAGKKADSMDFSGPDASASPTPAPPKFNVPIPPGHVATVMNIPYFDIHGKLQMYYSIKQAYRVDNDHLQMKNAYMETYDDKGAPDSTVFMSRSVLDLNSLIVTSEVPVTVLRADFEIVGRKMVFNTRTHIGRMTGHVRMVIYNRSEMSEASPSPSPGATPQAAATP